MKVKRTTGGWLTRFRVVLNENYYVDIDDYNHTLFFIFKDEKGKKVVKRLGYFSSMKGCLGFIIKHQARMSTQEKLTFNEYTKKLVEIKKELQEIIDNLNGDVK